jgi:acetyl-CoA decarbonylase/synthase complex subunit delta
MPFEVPKTAYSGKIREIKLGKGDKAVTIGGETAYPFYLFEGQMPNLPKIAMEVRRAPENRRGHAGLAGVTGDPVAGENASRTTARR